MAFHFSRSCPASIDCKYDAPSGRAEGLREQHIKNLYKMKVDFSKKFSTFGRSNTFAIKPNDIDYEEICNGPGRAGHPWKCVQKR